MTPEKKPTGFLDDDNGQPSSMRAMAMLAVIVAAALALADAFGWGDTTTTNYDTVLLFLGAGFGGKVGQKMSEVKKPPQ